jgi:capsular exopolysaccharide synthesis family protein
LSKYSARAEAFRQLRTNLQLAESNAEIKLLAVTSAVPNEGKTTTSLNLALSLSDSGQNIALIESDLRRPQLNLFLELDSQLPGVSEIVTNASALSDFRKNPKSMMQKVSPNFFVLTSGFIPPNAAELVGSSEFRVLLDSLAKNFDLVVLDCPPTLPIADAAVISQVSDGVLVVVKAGKTSIKQFKGAIATLKNVDANIIGCVLNMIPTNRRAEEYGYRYGYGYRSYYGYKGQKIDKSMYSPFEPYGPAFESVKTSQENQDDSSWIESSELHEVSFETSDQKGILRSQYIRARNALLNRLSQNLIKLEESAFTKTDVTPSSREANETVYETGKIIKDFNTDTKSRKSNFGAKFISVLNKRNQGKSILGMKSHAGDEEFPSGDDFLDEIISRLSSRESVSHDKSNRAKSLSLKSTPSKSKKSQTKKTAKKTAKKT